MELHIDEPEASVTSVDGPPHRWSPELYPLDEIEADADNIHGDLGDRAELLATYCPADTLPHTGGPVTLLALIGTAMIGGGLALRRRGGQEPAPDAAQTVLSAVRDVGVGKPPTSCSKA